MEPKDKKIIADAERDNIPVFVLIAKDKLSVEALKSYLHLCVYGDCDLEHTVSVSARIKEFAEWQEKNPDKVKLPD